MTKHTPIVNDEKKRRNTILGGSMTLPSAKAISSVATLVGVPFSKEVLKEEKRVLDQKHAAIDNENNDKKLGKQSQKNDVNVPRSRKP